MRKKHVLIEILPRALWIIEAMVLFLVQHFVSQEIFLKENIFLLSIGIFLIAFGSIYLLFAFIYLLKPMFTKELITSGPYRYSRHPMYVAIYLILIGFGLLFFSKEWFIVLLVFLPIWYLDCKIEESQMTDLHGEKYLEYKKKVGMFFPFN